MKFTSGLSVLAVFVTAALANIVPRDFATLKNDADVVSKDCLALKGAIEQLKAPIDATVLVSLITGSNNLSAALNALANDAKIAGPITDAQALALLSTSEKSIDDCIIPALNELSADAVLLATFKTEIEAELKKLQASYLACASNLITICPSAEKPEASQLAIKPNAALATCLKAYA
ncbi:hypothetical protein EV368DRAFT_67274 [Lentinula lateritia]|uniref:Uncharacterized protein n=1 Tax=Lentinula aff. lateritia TaxID=2804960 RepID=A0ACC1U934_9AGAR|nr:hypothetical protein F5876DRAFT_74234 [Lentinula aff. lateritia]KAJ3849648.1 hypothetical protein EV368DRAFT_67274 [Lentinula lateritia]